MTISALDTIDVVRRSQDRFAGLLQTLSMEQVTGPSYDDEWSIADVASHLGSQAEIFDLFVDAGLEGTEPPNHDAFIQIWDRWNAKPPTEQVADSIAANEALVSRIEGLPEGDRDAFRVQMFDAHRDLSSVVSMRLSEHAVHTWDIAVALDPAATLSPDAVDVLVESVPSLAGRAARTVAGATPVMVATTEPTRAYRVTFEPDVRVQAADGVAAADLTLPAEAFVRLVYGRLDPAHTPASVSGNHSRLADLRKAFPGF
jgi:uncharacterized protein (TIGR03083 family)